MVPIGMAEVLLARIDVDGATSESSEKIACFTAMLSGPASMINVAASHAERRFFDAEDRIVVVHDDEARADVDRTDSRDCWSGS